MPKVTQKMKWCNGSWIMEPKRLPKFKCDMCGHLHIWPPNVTESGKYVCDDCETLTDGPETMNDFSIHGCKCLAETVFLQAIRDFCTGWECKTGKCGCCKRKYIVPVSHQGRIAEMAMVKSWIKNPNGVFKFLATVWGKDWRVVQEMFLEKMKKIEAGEPLVLKNND